MTQDLTFRELYRPEPASDEFVPWSGIAAGPVPASQEFRPVFRPNPMEEECRKLTDGVERQRAEALAEIERQQAALDARMAELDRREEELARRQGEVESLEGSLSAQAGSLAALADDFDEMKKARWADNADEIVGFAMELADKIVKERVESDPTLLVGHLRSVLGELRVEETVSVHMAPDDLVALQRAGASDIRALLEHPHITWLGDSKLKRGEIHVDTSQFRLDASVMTALKNMRDDLTDARRDESDPEGNR